VLEGITKSVYNKLYLQREKYIILRKNTIEQVEDGVCFMKTIIDNYHSNTRSSTKQIRKPLATLNHYVRVVAKGDVSKLGEHTRELRDEQCEYTYILGELQRSTQEPKKDPSGPEGTARTPQAADQRPAVRSQTPALR
jgi:hypothetical protein